MAEKERLTNKERREVARRERKEQEVLAAAKAKKKKTSNTLFTLVALLVVGGLVYLAITSGPAKVPSGGIELTQAAALEGATAAGCTPTEGAVLEAREHFEPGQAPTADVLYTSVRPTHSGSHFRTPVEAGAYGGIVDERAITHSLEHGTVAVYSSPELDDSVKSDIDGWVEKLNAAGFRKPAAGSGILSADFDGPFTSGKQIAIRAWGYAVDCDSFNEDAFNGMVIEHFGSHGTSPEAGIGGYPDGVLGYTDVVTPTVEPSVSTTPGGDASPSDSPTDTPSGEPSAEPTDAPSPDASPTS